MMEQKYQPRICQQEFLHEGSSQSACQFFRALKRNPAQTVAPRSWNDPHSYRNNLTGYISPWSQCLPQPTWDRNSLWVEEAGLEGQDAELNSTAAGNRTLCEKGARWEVVAQAQVPLEAALPALGKSQGQEGSPLLPPRSCSHTSSGGNCAASEQVLTQNCTATGVLQRDRTCRTLHTHIMQKRNSVRIVCCDYRGGRRKSGGGENTDKGRKIAQEIPSFWNRTFFLSNYLKEKEGKDLRTMVLHQVSSWKVHLHLFGKLSSS